MSNNQTLLLFTISYPFTREENFLHPEVFYLSKIFKKIIIFPLYFNEHSMVYDLPENIDVAKFNMFQPYNRLKTVTMYPALIASVFWMELRRSKSRWRYLWNFKSSLNELTHKIAMSRSFSLFLNRHQITNPVAYTYWFNQWTFVLSLINWRKKQFSLFTRVHGMDVYEEQHKEPYFFFKFRCFQLNQIKKVIAISENGKLHLSAMNPHFASKMDVCRLGVADNGINKTENHLGFFRIVSCSAFQSYKRVHLIVEILKHSSLQIQWVHFGDGELKNDILKSAQSLPENVMFKWMGFKKNEDVISFYKHNHVDLFINTSSTEGIPVSIMEALSFGIPCIAPDVGGISEIVNDHTGFLIPAEFDPITVTQIIERYNNLDEEVKMEQRSKARLFYFENYCADKNYKNLIKTLTS
jgi:glycosyltransferase involved in cell wall biosynthesis